MLTTSCKSQVSQLVIDDEQCEKNVSINPDLALQHCTALVESGKLSEENLAKALIFRGFAYRSKGDYDRAIHDFDQAIRLKPDFANAFNNRGIAYDYKGNYDRAIQDFDQAIRLQPDYADAFNNRGLVYGEKGNYDRAIQDFDQAIRLRPAYAEALDNRAGAYLFKGDYDRAIQDYDQAIRVEPNNAGNFNDRAIAYNGKKNYHRALQDLDHAVQLSPRNASILGNRGVTYFYLGQFKAAENDLTLSVRLRPTDPYSVIWLYVVSARSGGNASVELKKNSAALKSTGWPQPVIQMYLRALTPSDVLASAKNEDAKKNSKQHCQAYFFLGEDALLSSHETEARRLFQDAIATRVMDSFEYMGAIAELDRMDAKTR
jgi:lipoprotein NlpI